MPEDNIESKLAVLGVQFQGINANLQRLNDSFDKLVRLEEKQLHINKRLDDMEARCGKAEAELETWKRWRMVLTPVAGAMSVGIGAVVWKLFEIGVAAP